MRKPQPFFNTRILMKLELLRDYYLRGTNGEIRLDGRKLCASIELPWRHNRRQVSCIPEGVYRLGKRYSLKYKWHLELLDVPGRSLILIHAANDAHRELRGCIAPVSHLTGEGRGNNSRAALQRLTELVFPLLERNEVVEITIKKKVS